MGVLVLVKVLLLLSLVHMMTSVAAGSRRSLTSLVEQPPLVLRYHKGDLLKGTLPINILWYGQFKPSQKTIVIDFINSLQSSTTTPNSKNSPTVGDWWKLVESYITKAAAGKQPANTKVLLGNQVSDDNYSLGKSLKRSQIAGLAAAKAATTANSITLVLTSKDVVVEGFCMSSCGFHDSAPLKIQQLPAAKKSSSSSSSGSSGKFAYIWVGNSEMQCPGQCAWPFHQPIYGPQTPPLVAPNNDVGLDGMIMNVASMIAAAVTNPYGDGFYQGEAGAQLEAASACPGMYGSGAFPGYAGKLLVDQKRGGGSYNANGVNNKKYLLPAVWNPNTSTCSTLV